MKSRNPFTWLVVLSLFGVLAAWMATPQAALAQQVTATITGRITDPSGAAVANAKVTVTSVECGVQYPATTNADGYYNLQYLPVGTYNVRVENAGFQAATQSNVTLQMNQIAKMDFQLQVGNVETTVEVTAAAPVLQTEATLLGQIVDARTNTTLPLISRNYVQLTLLAAGRSCGTARRASWCRWAISMQPRGR